MTMFAETLGMRFVEILPGRFTMGSPEDEIGREGDELQHQVTLTRGFRLADSPVTNREYRYMDPTHKGPTLYDQNLDGDQLPCTNVSLVQARAYCGWLTHQDSDWSYDLPTEAEWEYAARAGSNARFFWGEEESLAARFANVFDRTAMDSLPQFPRDGFDVIDGYTGASPVRQFAPNMYGLYDMLGNVWEMCRNVAYKYPKGPLVDPQGPATGNLYSLRGGDWLSIPFFARLANRTFSRPDEHSETVGFRVMARPKGMPISAQPTNRQSVNWHDIAPLFTQTDVDHMKAVSAQWNPPMHLDEYDSVRFYSMKIYSSVRTDRMPVPPVPTWTGEMKSKLRDWIYAGHPR